MHFWPIGTIHQLFLYMPRVWREVFYRSVALLILDKHKSIQVMWHVSEANDRLSPLWTLLLLIRSLKGLIIWESAAACCQFDPHCLSAAWNKCLLEWRSVEEKVPKKITIKMTLTWVLTFNSSNIQPHVPVLCQILGAQQWTTGLPPLSLWTHGVDSQIKSY